MTWWISSFTYCGCPSRMMSIWVVDSEWCSFDFTAASGCWYVSLSAVLTHWPLGGVAVILTLENKVNATGPDCNKPLPESMFTCQICSPESNFTRSALELDRYDVFRDLIPVSFPCRMWQVAGQASSFRTAMGWVEMVALLTLYLLNSFEETWKYPHFLQFLNIEMAQIFQIPMENVQSKLIVA